MNKLTGMDWLALILVVIGGLNWGLVSLFDLNIISAIFGDMTLLSKLIYDIVALAALYVLWAAGKWSRK